MSANEALELLNTYIIATKEAKIRNTEYKYSVEESSLVNFLKEAYPRKRSSSLACIARKIVQS